MAVRLAEVAAQEPIVATVCLPGNVENIAEDGNGSHQHADAEIGGHAHQCDVWHAANPCGQWDYQRQESGQHVAEARHQPDDSVDAESQLSAGHAKSFVEKDFELLQCLVAEQPCAAIPAVRARFVGHRKVVIRARCRITLRHSTPHRRSGSMLQSIGYMAAIVQRQNA